MGSLFLMCPDGYCQPTWLASPLPATKVINEYLYSDFKGCMTVECL